MYDFQTKNKPIYFLLVHHKLGGGFRDNLKKPLTYLNTMRMSDLR